MAALNLCEAREIPANWQKVSLSEFRKQKSETIEPSKFPEETFELYSVPSLETGRPEVVRGKEIGSNKQIVSRQDVLLSKINPRLNRSWIVRGFTEHETIASTEWIVFEKNPAILSIFLKNLLSQYSIRDFLASNASGVGGWLTRVKPSIVDGIKFGLPPLAEQKRIAAKLEELFSELDSGVDSLRTAQQQLKVYRQALLKHAFEGKLTTEWRAQNPDKLESAGALLARIQQGREVRYQQQLAEWKEAQKDWEAADKAGSKPTKPKEPKALPPLSAEELAELPELPKGWGWTRLGMLIDEPCYGTSKKCSYESGKVGVLRIPNISSGRIDAGDLKFSDFDDSEIAAYSLKCGDLLTIRSNGSISLVGQCALISEAEEDFLYAGYLIRLRPNQNLASPIFLLEVLGSHTLRRQIEHKAKSTSGVNNINSGEIQSLVVPLCSVEEQELISAMLGEKLSNLDQLESTITTSLQQVEALRQSILKKAFSGQLVPQHPDDEPASVLLERIRAERAAQEPTAKRGRKVAKPA